MKINLSRLLDRAVYKIDFEHAMELTNISSVIRDVVLVSPISIKGSVYKTDDGLFLDSIVTYEYYENCARCLKEFINKVETVLSGRLMEHLRSSNITDDDELIFNYDGDEVELTEHVLTSILLSLPMKSICDDNCIGLCLVCGKDLNNEKCNCNIQEIDPRLAKLKDLFD